MSDAILILSFGGPEKREDVIPFLENVLAGRNVPRERMLEVAEHYYHFGGISPINDHNKALIASLRSLLAQQGPKLPVYWGNRNWHPFLATTVEEMIADGITRCYAYATSAFGSYSGCRQYLEDIARATSNAGPRAPEILKLRLFYNHPIFIEVMADRVRAALGHIPSERREATAILYTAHSIPVSMAQSSPYVQQLEEACRLVSEMTGINEHRLVYQSRSGPPSQPWLEPDVLSVLRDIHQNGRTRDVMLAPIGFVSDHLEVLYDLDTEAKDLCDELGLNMVRAGTAGNDPRIAAMIRELVLERMGEQKQRRALGTSGPWPDVCSDTCCPAPRKPA